MTASPTTGSAVSEATQRLSLLVRSAGTEDVDVSEVEACVKEDADVMFVAEGQRRPVLQELVARGAEDAVRACLQTPRDLDFSVVSDDGGTVLCELCSCPSEEAAVRMLRLIRTRLETHPQDVVRWAAVNSYENDFLSVAADRQRLSLFFAEAADVPYYADQVEAIPLTLRVWSWDHDALEPDEQALVRVADPGMYRVASRVTGRFARLMEQVDGRFPSPDPREVRRLVEEGADVTFSEYENGSVLHELLWNGEFESALACIEASQHAIDFNRPDSCSRTLLHHVCGNFTCYLMPEQSVALLRAMLARIAEQEREDRATAAVDWMKETEWGDDFLSCAAEAQLLSSFWPLVRERVLAQLADHPAKGLPIKLRQQVWKFDWDDLSAEDKRYFSIDESFPARFSADRPTAELAKLCLLKGLDLECLRRAVDDGADIMVESLGDDPVLHAFLYRRSADPVQIILETKGRLDFTVTASDGWTALHYLVHGEASLEDKVKMLALVKKRVEEHPEDTFDWNMDDSRFGHTFAEEMCRFRLCDAFWPVLESVPYFQAERSAGRLADF